MTQYSIDLTVFSLRFSFKNFSFYFCETDHVLSGGILIALKEFLFGISCLTLSFCKSFNFLFF